VTELLESKMFWALLCGLIALWLWGKYDKHVFFKKVRQELKPYDLPNSIDSTMKYYKREITSYWRMGSSANDTAWFLAGGSKKRSTDLGEQVRVPHDFVTPAQRKGE